MAATDTFPPDYSTPVGQVRALIPDVEELPDPADLSAEAEYIFNDEIIQSYLAMSRDNIFRAAAFAVNTLATSEGLILKVLRSDDRATDGSKLADSLGKRADWLRRQADEEDEEMELYEAFNIYPYDPQPPLRGLR